VSKGDDVVDFLKKIYKTKPEAKKKVLTLCEKIKTKDAIAESVRALDDKDNDTVVFAMKSLGRVKDHEALRSLLRFFYISDDKVRTVAINAVIGYGADAVKQLIPILDDKNVEASQSATIALQKINTKDAIDALNLKKDKKEMESFLNDLENVNPQIRWRAAEALGKLKKKASVEPLMKALKDTNDMVRIKSVESLGIIGDDRAVEAIAKLLDNDDIKTRVACSKALVKIGKPAVAYLKTKVDDKKTGEYAKEIIKEIGAGLPGTQKK